MLPILELFLAMAALGVFVLYVLLEFHTRKDEAEISKGVKIAPPELKGSQRADYLRSRQWSFVQLFIMKAVLMATLTAILLVAYFVFKYEVSFFPAILCAALALVNLLQYLIKKERIPKPTITKEN